jgi:hypothetical protein
LSSILFYQKWEIYSNNHKEAFKLTFLKVFGGGNLQLTKLYFQSYFLLFIWKYVIQNIGVVTIALIWSLAVFQLIIWISQPLWIFNHSKNTKKCQIVNKSIVDKKTMRTKCHFTIIFAKSNILEIVGIWGIWYSTEETNNKNEKKVLHFVRFRFSKSWIRCFYWFVYAFANN